MSKPTRCPYCDSETFYPEAIPAGPKLDTVGDWFNKCNKCNKWSSYVDAPKLDKQSQQLKIKDPEIEPRPWQL